MSGALPAVAAAAFTLAEIAALSIIAAEVKRRGRCELHIGAIAAMAGVCRTVVQNACREAARLALIRVTERRRRGQRSDTNVIEIAAPEWLSWLKIGGSKADRVHKSKHHENRLLGTCQIAGKTLPGTASDSCVLFPFSPHLPVRDAARQAGPWTDNRTPEVLKSSPSR